MGTDDIQRHVHMIHPNPHYWKLSLDVKSVSRGGVGRRNIKLPYRHKHHYGLSRAIVCVSAKIHNRRGLSHVPLHDPFGALEPATSNLPQEFLGPVNEALTSYHGTPSSSGRSSPTITETQSTVSLAQPGGWTTGNTTERSSTDSTYSWDEFDKQAAKTVQFFFDQIDSVLYEQNVDGPLYIQKECQEWSLRFPHLRILGKQLMSPQDQGFQLIEREGSRPSTGNLGLMDVTDVDIAATQDIQGLSLAGRHLGARKPPVEARANRLGSDAPINEFTHLEEEIFEQEGEYEEIIAIEYKDIYDESSDKKQLTPRRRRVGYPPITPNASIKDSVISSAFDSLWQEIVSWKKPLVKKYTNIVLEETKPLVIPIQDVPNLSSHNARNDPLPPSREPSFQFLNPKLQRSNTTVGVPRLDDVLKISRKNLQIRENSSLHDNDPIINTARPGSSVNLSHKSRPVSVKLPQRIPPPQRGAMIRLAPINLTDRSKTPNVEEERTGPNGALKVTRLTPQNESLTSPPSHQRNGALPPLSAEIDVSVPSQIRLQKKVHSANRASSAVDKDIRGLHRERYTLQSDARPSTTHAMRSDTPLGGTTSRRASTPFGLNAFPQRSTALGITGSGLQPSTDLGHLGNYPPDILEDAEANIDDVYHNQWTPSPPSHHNPYRRLKQVSSLVRS